MPVVDLENPHEVCISHRLSHPRLCTQFTPPLATPVRQSGSWRVWVVTRAFLIFFSCIFLIFSTE